MNIKMKKTWQIFILSMGLWITACSAPSAPTLPIGDTTTTTVSSDTMTLDGVTHTASTDVSFRAVYEAGADQTTFLMRDVVTDIGFAGTFTGQPVAGASYTSTGNTLTVAQTTVLSTGVISGMNPDVNTPSTVNITAAGASGTGNVEGNFDVSVCDLAAVCTPHTGTFSIARELDLAAPPVVAMPDLQIVIDSVVNNGSFSAEVTYTVTNVGTVDAGSFNVEVWGNRIASPTYGDASSGAFGSHSSGLTAGSSATQMVAVGGTWTASVSYDAYVVADFSERVSETSETLTGTNDNLSTRTWTAQ